MGPDFEGGGGVSEEGATTLVVPYAHPCLLYSEKSFNFYKMCEKQIVFILII
jgi:hypothetical protein